MNTQELKNILVNKWGELEKPHMFSSDPKLFEFINFNELDSESKVFLCEIMMKSSSPYVGNIRADGDIQWLIDSIANDIFTDDSGVNRRISPLKTAFKILAPNFGDMHALLTPYLLAETEYQIRIRTRYLDYKGVIKRKLPKQISKNSKIGGRVNQIQIAYQLLLYRNTTTLGIKLKELDKNLPSSYKVSENGKQMTLRGGISGKFIKLKTVADRLQNTRNAIMHGEMHFISTEAFFYALLLSIFFYYDPRDT